MNSIKKQDTKDRLVGGGKSFFSACSNDKSIDSAFEDRNDRAFSGDIGAFCGKIGTAGEEYGEFELKI